VYETPNLEKKGETWDIDFEVLEDGEYDVWVECSYACYRIEVYILKKAEEISEEELTIPY